ncbi:hypothetical protein AOE01nite_20270 [Acetobacter oeni]|uniref:Uncharacterized protein n=1 Tax=Acetobacter oeni TaxID=304077 RepID=A0A511XLH4_9PROT|nr:hypothetical protein AOE01nite_20270 [Acetobacter oeni]
MLFAAGAGFFAGVIESSALVSVVTWARAGPEKGVTQAVARPVRLMTSRIRGEKAR